MVSTINAPGEDLSLLSVESTPVADPSGGTGDLAVDQFENFLMLQILVNLNISLIFFSIHVYAW